jgi:cellulose synthase/poly-beta-1,6-N-acetylglucosamine synthase-like glycosyltransferase
LLATIEAAKCNSSCDQALLGEGLMRDEVFYRFLAAHLNAPFYTGEIAVDQSVDAARAVWSGVAPLAPNDRGLRHLLAPRGAAITLLLRAAQRGGVPDDIAIASPQRFGAATRAAAARSIAHAGAFDLKTYDAELTAHSRLTLAQTAAAIVSALASLVLWALNPDWLGSVFSVALFIIFASSIGLRLAAVAARSPFFSAEPIADADLPIYSIVAPLYREANMVDQLVAAFDAIDYPRAKLDVKIVVEEDDIETLRAIARRRLPARYDIVVAPAGAPRTKPRALNIALPFVRGSYVVVFDAEDMPAPDQLRCAAAYFAAAPDVGCLQARLVVHNAATSWLATMYAIEYAALFGVINPGLAALGAPIALGGTSNHFRTAALRRVGGWDAWNLTEDADLGIRLARFGVRVATFDSDTYEEAPARLSHWLGQRRRWQKGWLQTALVHSRNPARLVRELGAARAFSALGLIGGTILGCLFGPLFTVLALWRAAFGDLLAPATPFQAFVSIMAISMLLSGLTAILVPTILGLRRRGLGRFSWALALLPIYYCLISLATWLAVYDFVFWPFYWCKTQHGVGFARPPSPVQPE